MYVDRGSGFGAFCSAAPCFLPESHQREAGSDNAKMLRVLVTGDTTSIVVQHNSCKLANEMRLVELTVFIQLRTSWYDHEVVNTKLLAPWDSLPSS